MESLKVSIGNRPIGSNVNPGIGHARACFTGFRRARLPRPRLGVRLGSSTDQSRNEVTLSHLAVRWRARHVGLADHCYDPGGLQPSARSS